MAEDNGRYHMNEGFRVVVYEQNGKYDVVFGFDDAKVRKDLMEKAKSEAVHVIHLYKDVNSRGVEVIGGVARKAHEEKVEWAGLLSKL